MHDLAVVPIFVNAGAAVLPAIVGGLASGVALLFKPRELFRLFRQRPIVPAILAAVGVVLWFAVQWISAAAAEGPKPVAAAQPFDWGDVGRRIVTARKLAAMGTSTRPAGISEEVILGHDAGR